MKTRVATYIHRGAVREVVDAARAAITEQLGNERPQFIVVFASTKQPLAELAPLLADAFEGAILVGCSSAGEFTENGDMDGAVSIFAVHGDFKIHAGMAVGLRSDVERTVTAAVGALPASIDGYPHRTALLLVDGLFGAGEEATLIAASLLGEVVPLAGGAAGDDVQMKATYVACGREVASDAVVIAEIFSKAPLGVGVAHGHVPISKAFQVTKAEGNVVFEIDGRPAWDVWREETRSRTDESGMNPDELQGGDIMRYLGLYEAGLEIGDEFKVRVPIGRGENGALAFACGIPEGTILRIMDTDPERQVRSAGQAARRAREKLGVQAPAGALVFDCTGRKLLLGGEFSKAVKTIAHELDAKIAGFESYGEIAMNMGDFSGYHNTTTVVLAFPSGS